MKKIAVLFLLCFSCRCASAQEPEIYVSDSLRTSAGMLRVVRVQRLPEAAFHAVVIGEDVILRTDQLPESDMQGLSGTPAVHTYFRRPLYQFTNGTGEKIFEEVVLLNQFTNFCEFGPMWFIGIKEDGSYERTEKFIPGCRSLRKVTWSMDRIEVSSNDGTETWIYEGGSLRKAE